MMIRIKQKLNNKKEELKHKRLAKKGYLNKNAKYCGLAVVKEIKNNRADVRLYGDAMCRIEDDTAYDILTNIPMIYKVLSDNLNNNAIVNAINNHELEVNEVFCFSVDDYKKTFPGLDIKQTKKEVIDYLKYYNEKEDVSIYWTFLDKDEVEKLNNKKKRITMQ